MSKLDAFDVLHKMEVLLFYAKSPLQKEQIKDIILSDIDNDVDLDLFSFTILPNGNFCEYIGSNDWIHIYKEVHSGLGRLNPFPRYYFKTKYAPLELLRLNTKNLVNNVQGTDHESAIISFLNNNRLINKDKKTLELLIITKPLWTKVP